MNDMANELYSLGLFEELKIDSLTFVMRVPGGWIFQRGDEQIGGHWKTAAAFIPFDNEFQPNP